MTTVPTAAREPRRLRRPRWLDPRVIGGVLLVIACVVIGSRVIAATTRTSPVWTATGDLAVGTILADDDLALVEVNLGTAGGLYLGAGASPVGRALSAPIRSGEMIPATAVTLAPAGRVVVIPVPVDKFPADVGHGSVVDLYLTTDGEGGVPQTVLLQADLTVQQVVPPSSGGLSGASANAYQLSVLVSAGDAATLIKALPTGEAVVALVAGS